MTPDKLLHRFCVLLAFQSLIANGKKIESKDSTERVVELAKRMDEFCGLYVNRAFPPETEIFVDDRGVAKTDAALAQYLEELRTKETTHLPEDRETLIQLYDRLQQRKARRLQWQFYATVKEEKLADLILNLLDEEIEDMNMGAKQ